MRSEIERPLTWPAGAVWGYHASIANGAGGGGNLLWEIVPGARTEMEVLYMSIWNGDGSARTGTAWINDTAGGNVFTQVLNLSVPSAAYIVWPGANNSSSNMSSAKLILSGVMELEARLSSVAASQDGRFGIVARIRGALPTVTETGNSTPTITINQEGIL